MRGNSLNDVTELFLEKRRRQSNKVDSSAGGIGSAVNRAIETLVLIITKADVSRAAREKWLDRLWDALQEDDMPTSRTSASSRASYPQRRRLHPNGLIICRRRLRRCETTARVVGSMDISKGRMPA